MSEGIQHRMYMTLACEVQPCPNMAMRGFHTLWVTTDRNKDNTKISQFISWQTGSRKEMTILIGSMSGLNFEIQAKKIEHSLIIINFAQLSLKNAVQTKTVRCKAKTFSFA